MGSFENLDVGVELQPAQARKLLSHILRTGRVVFWSHALDALADDGRSERDALNVMRGGQIHEPGEWKDDLWRYRVHTARMCVVVGFESTTMTLVVTAWEKKR